MDRNEDVIARNRKAVIAFLDGMVQTDRALMRSAFHEDAGMRMPRPTMDKVIRGADNLADFLFELSKASYIDPHATTDMLVVDEKHGAAEWNLKARKVDGDDYSQFYFWAFDFADGLIVEVREYLDTHYGLQANGQKGNAAIASHS